MLSSETGFITQPRWQWCTLGPHSELVQELRKQCWHSGNSRAYMYTEHCNWLKSEIVLIDHSLACILKKTLIRGCRRRAGCLCIWRHTHWLHLSISITVSCVKCVKEYILTWINITPYTCVHRFPFTDLVVYHCVKCWTCQDLTQIKWMNPNGIVSLILANRSPHYKETLERGGRSGGSSRTCM